MQGRDSCCGFRLTRFCGILMRCFGPSSTRRFVQSRMSPADRRHRTAPHPTAATFSREGEDGLLLSPCGRAGVRVSGAAATQ